MTKEITKKLICLDISGNLSTKVNKAKNTEDILSTLTLTEDEIKLVNLFKSLNDLSIETLLEKLKSSNDHDEKLLIMTVIIDDINPDSPGFIELKSLVSQYEYKNLMLEVYNISDTLGVLGGILVKNK